MLVKGGPGIFWHTNRYPYPCWIFFRSGWTRNWLFYLISQLEVMSVSAEMIMHTRLRFQYFCFVIHFTGELADNFISVMNYCKRYKTGYSNDFYTISPTKMDIKFSTIMKELKCTVLCDHLLTYDFCGKKEHTMVTYTLNLNHIIKHQGMFL